jgi:hypothetical protein
MHAACSFCGDEVARQSLRERLRALHEVTGVRNDKALGAQLGRKRVADPLDRAGVSA